MTTLAFIGLIAVGLVVIVGALAIYNRTRDSIILNDPHEHIPEDYDE